MRATAINDEMKIAAAHALAELAREDVPDEVATAYATRRAAIRPALHSAEAVRPPAHRPPAAGGGAGRRWTPGVAGRPIADFEDYRHRLEARLDPTATHMHRVQAEAQAHPTRMVFAEGEEEKVIRAAIQWHAAGLGSAVLIGRERRIQEILAAMGLREPGGLEVHNARLSEHNGRYTDFLYERLQRKGYLRRDCQRMVNQDRNVFARVHGGARAWRRPW